MGRLRVPRPIGRPKTTPDAVLADKAYSSRAIRGHLRRRGIRAVIPQPAGQAANRKRLGRLGGLRPPGLQAAQHRRAVHQQAQAMARPRHSIRQDRDRLPRRHLHLVSEMIRRKGPRRSGIRTTADSRGGWCISHSDARAAHSAVTGVDGLRKWWCASAVRRAWRCALQPIVACRRRVRSQTLAGVGWSLHAGIR